MFNQVTAIGNLTRDWELKYLPNGSALASNSIATSHKYKTQSGESKEEVCFLEITVFGKGAEIINQYTHKGSKLFVQGRLIFEQWDAQDGSKRSRHALRVEDFKFLDSKNENQQQTNNYQKQHQDQKQNGYQPEPTTNHKNNDINIDESEIPF